MTERCFFPDGPDGKKDADTLWKSLELHRDVVKGLYDEATYPVARRAALNYDIEIRKCVIGSSAKGSVNISILNQFLLGRARADAEGEEMRL